MIGKNKLILNDETMTGIIENYFKNTLFKEMDFSVVAVDHHSYKSEWEITLEGKEVNDG